MEKQFELNYAASPTEVKAQVQAFLNAVGTKLCEIDEHESLSPGLNLSQRPFQT